ncbi:MAG: epoxide hydrolase [Chloroflexi bacterium]|nr:epoxide hydrolase [Chloroflexota bacterium]MQC27702.1 epoxide hydrolase [Chloroflexota bacterium]
MSMLPFRIDFSERAIADLHRRIDATRWPELGYDLGWTTGTNDAVLRDLVRYWRRDYDWFAVQEQLNRLAHLRGPIEGEELHCVVYAGPGSARRLPVLLLHGWPGSFVEFLDAAELLAAGVDGGPGFDLVVPSLPGFAFSEAPRAPGLHPGRIAERMHALMRTLGFERYGVQGGDWGGIIGPALAQRHPEAVIGLHVNFGTARMPAAEESELTAAELEHRERRRRFEAEETGYSRIQGTRPQTLAYGLQDSPVGLLAWILEKFWVWSDHGDDLWDTFDRDRLLTNVMLYWLTGSVLSAARIYYETSHMTERLLDGPVTVPTAYARFPGEPFNPPREAMGRAFNLVRYSEPAHGGHFAAMEQPALFAADVTEFFGALPG